MGALSQRNQQNSNIWPGFVDALATLLMVVIFLLMIFVLAQFFLGQALSGKDTALNKLRGQVGELADLLALERVASKNLKTNVQELSEELRLSVALRDDLGSTVSVMRRKAEETEGRLMSAQTNVTNLQTAMETSRRTIEGQMAEMTELNNDVAALRALRQDLESKIAAMADKANQAEQALARSKDETNQAEQALARSKDQTESLRTDFAATHRELEESRGNLLKERDLSKSARAQVALLNQQMSALRAQLSKIAAALDTSEKQAKIKQTRIINLGKRLNAALAGKVQELSRYRSEFFGRLRDLLGKQPGVQIVGDRFVFQSEVLFAKGSADIGTAGRNQMVALASTLTQISKRIPADLDWVLRVDGHTDSDAIKTTQYPSNWELSSARAIAVVRDLIDAGLPANRLVAAGFGEFQPLKRGSTEIIKSLNRRIELKLTQR